MTAIDDYHRTGMAKDVVILFISGLILLVLISLIWLKDVRRLIDGRPAIIVNSLGVAEHASDAVAGLIPWSQIAGFHISTVVTRSFPLHFIGIKRKYLVVKVAEPQKYIDACYGLWRWVAKSNHQKHGSPIVIDVIRIEGTLERLLELINDFYARYAVHYAQKPKAIEGGFFKSI